MKTLTFTVLSVLVVAIAVLAVFLVPKMIANHELNVRHEAIEGSLTPPPGWIQVNETRHPASILCFNMDSSCPSSLRTYEVEALTPDQMVSIAPAAAMVEEGDCRHQGNEAGQSTACTAKGHQDGFFVSAWGVSLSAGKIEVAVSIELAPAA